MTAGTHIEVVHDAAAQQLGMEVVVHPEEEIVVTAVDNDRQIAVGDTRDQVDRRSRLPSFGMLGLRAQQLRKPPMLSPVIARPLRSRETG